MVLSGGWIMYKKVLFLTIVLSGLFGVVSTAPAQELLTNPGFEEGTNAILWDETIPPSGRQKYGNRDWAGWRTKRIPVRALRSSMGGGPPLGRSGRFGDIGSISFRNFSPSSDLVILLFSIIVPKMLTSIGHFHQTNRCFNFRFY